jgi:phosphatidylinositol alpha 1,6-mannosyltransferase
VTTYVALGDSFTAGLVAGEPRWADEVARALGPDVRYENLAWIGATSADVEHKQLGRALALGPDVVTIVCGANDVLESVRPDAEAYARRLARMFARLRREAPEAEVVTATYPDISRFLDLRPRTRARVEKGMRVFNAACRRVARSHGVALLEGFDHPAATDRGTYAEDGFHPSEEGHRRAAMEFLRALRGRFRPRGAAPA